MRIKKFNESWQNHDILDYFWDLEDDGIISIKNILKMNVESNIRSYFLNRLQPHHRNKQNPKRQSGRLMFEESTLQTIWRSVGEILIGIGEDDFEYIKNAVLMIRGVLSIAEDVANANDWIARERIKMEMKQKIFQVLAD